MVEDPGSKALSLSTQVRKIEFVEFTTDLVRNVYSTIVQSSMDQLRAYADFVRQVSKSLLEYQNDAIGATPIAQDATADSYIKDVLGLDPTQDPINLTAEQTQALIEHFGGIRRASPPETIDIAIIGAGDTRTITRANLRSFVIEKLKASATNSYELLKTILQIGMQKIVVSDGMIETKLTFHVDSSDVQTRTATNYQSKGKDWGIRGGITGRYGGVGLGSTTIGNFIGGGISGGYSSRKLNVSVVNETSTAALNVRIDIIGGVRINFRTETFPAPPIT